MIYKHELPQWINDIPTDVNEGHILAPMGGQDNKWPLACQNHPADLCLSPVLLYWV